MINKSALVATMVGLGVATSVVIWRHAPTKTAMGPMSSPRANDADHAAHRDGNAPSVSPMGQSLQNAPIDAAAAGAKTMTSLAAVPVMKPQQMKPAQNVMNEMPPPQVSPGAGQAPAVGGGQPADKTPADPVAREALAFVGEDPEAEQIWMSAINNPNLLPEERSNLIEDLNEDGFPDPKNITADDLPLIVSRMSLIEAIAPTALDDVNAAAFQEAYKDLSNMLAKFQPR